jgi:hypothetical protein
LSPYGFTIRTPVACTHHGICLQLIENGKPVAKYCAHPEIWTPDGDTMIAQLLMLKTDEARFLQIANRLR